MLEDSFLDILKNKKNLLAFSAGVDSTALFFLLLKNNIKFDIAIVNYNVRKQSQKELEYAQELASIHNLKIHSLNAPKIDKNFEAKAREIRYDFFEELIKTYAYENLITAHHLGDRLEWMLMQFCKGAGCAEIAGMQKVQHRNSYTLVRPLLKLDKKELFAYLHANNIKYFEDESNLDEDIKRNSFRHSYASPLLDKYLDGIKKSFDYLDEDRAALIQEVEIKNIKDFAYFKKLQSKRADIFVIDKYLKSKSYMLSASEREMLKKEKITIVGRKFLVNQEKDFVFIVPYSQENFHTPRVLPHNGSGRMPKEFKEECRILKIDPKLRPYLYENEEAFLKVKELLASV